MSERGLIEIMLGTYCTVTTFLRYTIPFKDTYDLYKSRVTHKFPYFVQVFTILNNLLWYVYFCRRYDFFILVCCCYGTAAPLLQLTVFIYCFPMRSSFKYLFFFLSLILPVTIIMFWIILDIRISINAYVAILFNIMMFASPMQKVKDCIREKDNTFLPIRLILLNMSSSFGYVIYTSVYIHNYYMFFCHILSLVFSFTQTYFYLKYREDDGLIEEGQYRELDLAHGKNIDNSTQSFDQDRKDSRLYSRYLSFKEKRSFHCRRKEGSEKLKRNFLPFEENDFKASLDFEADIAAIKTRKETKESKEAQSKKAINTVNEEYKQFYSKSQTESHIRNMHIKDKSENLNRDSYLSTYFMV
mmetsp:Transcript_20453/g.21230  ORF Transcript_20453/g.21230 Transcript_20453/m.21230 type:complete len:357 (-) Transcript_20453:29-1099(-)